MKYFKASAFFMVSVVVAVFGYFEAVAFSTALPMPNFVLEYSKTTGNPSNAYYWGFIVVTLNLPYAFLAGVIGYLSGRYTYFWLASAAFGVSLIYFRGLTLGFVHWWSMFAMAILSSVLLALFGAKTRNKAKQQGPTAGTR